MRMRKENWVLVLAATLAMGIGATPVRAQQTAGPVTSEAASQPAADSVNAERRSQLPRKRIGSPYVELDSWIYPALERLAALGYIHSEFSDMRPWTRGECARMVQEAGTVLDVDPGGSSEAQRFYAALRNEFQGEFGELSGAEGERTVRLESLYSRVTGISGQPLNDSYHFGQTIINNYGRPYQEGFNSYDGFSGYAAAGRFVIYTRGEFQHAPSAPAYPLSARQAIATADGNPLQPATPFPRVDQFRLLDTYAGVNVGGWDLTFGKQSLWWARIVVGAWCLAATAEPFNL